MDQENPFASLEDGSIDAGLVVLAAITPRDVVWTQDEIAAVCGCSQQLIQRIERNAMRKLRLEFKRRQIEGAFV